MGQKHKKKQSYSTSVLESVGNELKENPPKILARTRARFGVKRAEKQRVAILLSKARKRGAKVKRKKRSK